MIQPEVQTPPQPAGLPALPDLHAELVGVIPYSPEEMHGFHAKGIEGAEPKRLFATTLAFHIHSQQSLHQLQGQERKLMDRHPIPPIPPTYDLELIPQADGDIWISGLFLDPENVEHRQIIASVAFTLWRNESVRLMNSKPIAEWPAEWMEGSGAYAASENGMAWLEWARFENLR